MAMSKRLYVGNLDRTITEAEIETFFSSYGKVVSVLIKRDSVTGEPWGYGFVEMENVSTAEAVLKQANGKLLKRSKINIDPMP
jgi:RNA recognition motif-containing protein